MTETGHGRCAKNYQANAPSEGNCCGVIAVLTIRIKLNHSVCRHPWSDTPQTPHHTVIQARRCFRAHFRVNTKVNRNLCHSTLSLMLWSCKLPVAPDTSSYRLWEIWMSSSVEGGSWSLRRVTYTIQTSNRTTMSTCVLFEPYYIPRSIFDCLCKWLKSFTLPFHCHPFAIWLNFK